MDGLERVRGLLEPDESLVERAVSTDREWQGRIFAVEHTLVELPDGSRDWREIVRHHGGAGVLVVRDGLMCLVRQWRVALGRMTLEIPAGKVDPNEDPAVCAARELEEETGLVAEDLELIAISNGAPGFTDEHTVVFYAPKVRQGEASPDEGELVNVVWLPVDEVLAAVRAGLLEDAKTVIAAQFAALMSRGR